MIAYFVWYAIGTAVGIIAEALAPKVWRRIVAEARYWRAVYAQASYMWRPYDMVADRRRWFWQVPTPCQWAKRRSDR